MSSRKPVPSIVVSLQNAARAAVGLPATFELLESRTLMAAQANESSMAYDASGNLHLAYYDQASKNLKYTSQSPGGAWSDVMLVDSASSDVGRSPSLAVTGAGRPGVAYYDAANADLRFAMYDGSTWKSVAVDTKGDVGQNPSLAFDNKGNAVISYYDATNGDLKLATLKNLAKNKWEIARVVKHGDVGQFSSLAIDPAKGKPVVAFTDSQGRIQVTAAKSKPVVIDDTAGDPAPVGIGFTPSGSPAVSYFDTATGDIKVGQADSAKSKTFATTAIANVPLGSDPKAKLLIDPSTGEPRVVYYDLATDGVYVGTKKADGGVVEKQQLQSGGDTFIAAVQPGNGSISFTVVDNSGSNPTPAKLNNTATTPLPPSNVQANADSESSVSITWTDNATNETGFQIERSADGASWAVIAQAAPNTTAYTDSAVEEGTTYYYRVSATGGAGETSIGTAGPVVRGSESSSNGSLHSVRVTTLPKKPTALNAVSVSSSQIDLAWQDHSSAETGYTVERATAGSGAWETVGLLSADATTYSDTLAAEGVSYDYRVFATVGNVSSNPSNVATAATLPATPTGLTVTQFSTSRLDIAWTNNAASVATFVLQRSTNGTNWTTVAQTEATQTSYSDSSLAEGSDYYYRVKAVGALSSTYSVVGNGSTKSATPTNLAATAVSPSRIDLTWTDNSTHETGYLVQRSSGGGAFVTITELAANTTSYSDTGRSEGIVYAYRVRTTQGGNSDSNYSATASTTTLPSAPTQLVASALDGGLHVTLAWQDNSTGETGFQVQRQTAGSNTWTTLATVAANQTTYADSTAAEATGYTYRVRAMNAAGFSALSNDAAFTTVPTGPGSLATQATSSSEIVLSWTDRSSGEGHYVVERSSDGITFSALATLPANASGYTDSGLDAASSFTYRVKATNAGGDSAYTLAVSAVTLCDAPSSLTVTGVNGTSISLSWSASTGAVFYALERSADGGVTWSSLVDTDDTSFTDSVPESRTFNYRVRAVNEGGVSEESASVAATSKPAAPSGLTATAASDGSVALTWVDHSSGETGFTIERSDDGGATFGQTFTVNANVTTFTDGGVPESTAFVYRVTATNEAGASASSNSASVTTRPAAPGDVAADATSATTVLVSWDDQSQGESGYRVERSLDQTAWTVVGNVGAGVQSFTDSGLTANTNYYYRVTTKSAAGDSQPVAVAATTLTLPPTGLNASTLGTDSVQLSWTAPTGATGFVIERSVDNIEFATVAQIDANVLTFTDDNLQEGTSYYYNVRAVNGGGASAAAGAIGTTRPAAPSDLSALAVSATQVELNWTDNSGGENGVYVEISTDNGLTFADAGQVLEDVTTFTVNVAEGSTPVFRVRAITDGVFSDYSDTAAAETVPATPGGVTVASRSDSQLRVSWTDNSSGETGFLIERSDDGMSFVQVGTAAANATSFDDANLDEGTTYYYRVRATMGLSRNSEYSDVSTNVTRPTRPTGLTAMLDGSGVDLAWGNPSINAESYVIERSADAGSTWTEVGTSESTTFTDTSTSAGLTYAYRVRSVNAGGESANSQPAMATLVPESPLPVSAVLQPNGDVVHVSWNNVAGETNFEIYRSSDNGSSWSKIGTVGPDVLSFDDNTIAQHTAYRYRLRSVNASGSSPDSSEMAVDTTFITPSNLAGSTTTSSVSLTWQDNASGETNYLIQRSTDHGDHWSLLATVAADSQSFTDSSVNAGTAYSYRVAATNGSATSSYSTPTDQVTPLRTPTDVVSLSASATTVTLSWTNTSTNHLGTQIWKSTDGVTFTQIDFVAPNVTIWSDSQLHEATTYTYKLRAANAIATSAYTTPVAQATRPASPTGLSATVNSASQITLSWTDASIAATSGFVVRRSLNGTTWTDAGTTSSGVTMFADTGLSEGTQYRYRVTAKNDAGESIAASVTATTNPAAPTGLVATASNPTTVNLSWTNPSTNFSDVRVERRLSGGAWGTLATLPGSTSYQDTTVTEGTGYEYRLIAIGTHESAPTAAATLTTPPAAVSDLAAYPASDHVVGLTWTDNAAHETGYRVERSSDGVTYSTLTTLPADSTDYEDNTGSEGTTYSYRVVSVQNALETASGAVAAQTLPTAPTNLLVSSPSAGVVELSWDDNSSRETSYRIERSDDLTNFQYLDSVDADETTFTDSVAPGSLHYYRVMAVRGSVSAPSNEVGTYSRPDAASDLIVLGRSPASITLQWTNPSGGTGYTIERSTDGVSFVTAGVTAGNSFADTGLDESTAYTYRVIAENSAGTATPSATVLTRTTPAAPTSLAVSAASPTSVDVTWTNHSTSNSSAMKVYRAPGLSPVESDFVLLASVDPSDEAYTDATASGGTAYTYSIALDDGTEATDLLAPVSVTTPPAAVTGLSSISNSPTSVDLAWFGSTGAATYTVERSTDGVTFIELADDVAANSYQDQTATEATDYTYRVTPTGVGGNGPGETIIATTLPAGVTTMDVTAKTDTSVSLSWSDNSGGETGYRIERSPDGENWVALTTLSADTTTYTDATALEATTYAYRAIPEGMGGDGTSDVVDVTTLPTAATGLSATGVSATEVTVAWTDVSVGNSGYELYRATGAGAFAKIADLGAGDVSYDDTTVAAATGYTYKVVAIGAGGSSADSNTSAVTTVPAAVTDLSATMVSTTRVDLSWSDVAGNASYRIERSLNGGAFSTLVSNVGADAVSYSDTTALEGRTYDYRIVAVNTGGDSASSNTSSAVTPPAAPTALAAADTDATTIRLSWTDNSQGETSVTVERFDGSTWSTLAELSADTVSYDDTVATGSTYSYRVFMSRDGVASGTSATQSATTVPGQVSGVTTAATGTSLVSVSWSSVSGATGYRVFRSDDGGSTWGQVGSDLPANAASYDDASVAEATSYSFKVLAFNASGDGAESAVSTVTTFPEGPTSLAVDTISTTAVDLSWTDTSNGESGFAIYRSTDGGATFALLASVGTDVDSYSDSAIDPATTYTYQVTATNGAGESDPTANVDALTRPAAPVIALASETATTATIAWTSVSGATAGYVLYRNNGSGFNQIATPAAGDTSYVDSTLDESTAYTYRLTAANVTGEGAASNDLAMTTAPAAPSGVGALSVTTTSLTVTWTDNAAGETGFLVERSSDGGATWQSAGSAAAIAGTGSGGTLAQSGLTEGADYVYRVRATLNDLESADSGTFNVTTLPNAPTAMTVGEVTDGTVALSWTDNSAGETGYAIQRSVDGGSTWADLTSVGAGVTSYVDSTVDEGGSYSYRVKAVRNAVSSATSNVVSADTLPATPTSLAATADDPTTVTLTWNDESANEDGYLVERSVDGGANWVQIGTVADDVETYTDSAAPESATSQYRVRATKGLLESANSNTDSVTTPVAQPTSVVASATSDSAMTVTWTDNSGVETAQRLERSSDSGVTWSSVADLAANTVSYGDTGLTEDTTYQYRVVAAVGEAESAASTASVGVKTPLAAPTGLTASSSTATSVSLSWTNHSAAAANVVIERSTDGGVTWSTRSTQSGSTTTFTDSSVSEGTAYSYRVGATKVGNASAVSAVAAVTTLPAAPTGLSVTAFSASQIDLAWTDHAGSETGYKVFRSDNGGSYNEVANLAADSVSFSDTGVHEGGTFAYIVYAYGVGGDSAQATNTLVTAPADPTAFAATPVTATRVDLAWTDNSGGETNYVVQRSSDGGSTWSALATLDPDVHAYSDTSALEAHSYNYRVKAVRSSASSAWATTTATTVPAAPSSLTATVPAGPAKVNLSWTDNSAGENGYQLERSADNGSSWSLVTSPAANATTYSDTTVTEGTTYVYRLRATSAAGNSDWSATSTASTLPATPTSLAAAVAGPTQVNLTWTDNSAHETGFIVERSIGGTTWSQVATPAANATTYSDTAAAEGITYQYRVRAVTTAATGSASGTASASTPLMAPSGVTATAVSTTRVNLAWTDNSSAESSYKVERSTDGGVTFSLLTTLSSNVTSYADTTASAGTTYVYRVRAAKSSIYSAYGTAAAVTTVPTAPASATATAASDTTVNLTWSDAQGETAYTVERSNDGGANWTVLTSAVAANATSYADSTAQEETAYLYRVKATNSAGASAYATSASVTTLPSAPSDLAAETQSTDTISLSWTDHSQAETGFKIERQVQGSNSWAQIATVGANVTSYIDSTGDESVTYEYRVRATTGGRNSVYSNTTMATTLPIAPTDLAVTASDASSVQLSWVNDSAAPSMVIERSADGGDTFLAIATTGQGSTSYTNTGLASGTTYVYRIRGYNGDGGFSDPTNTVIATTA